MKRFGLCLKMTCVLLLVVAPAARAQAPTKEEERLAHEAAAAFSERLLATRDFGPVVKELYAADFMRRYLLRASELQKVAKADHFMLYGVPALEFRTELLARPDDEHWPRLYAAASDLMLYTYLSLLAKGSIRDLADPNRLRVADILAVYPPEAVKLLAQNRTTANFITRSGATVAVATPEELRRATKTLEEAARLTRQRLDETLASRGPQLAQNLEVLKAGSERSVVGVLVDAGTAPVATPPGTRVFKVFSPLLYDLYLVSEGGRMRVVWASLLTN